MTVYDKNTDTHDSEKNTHVMYTLHIKKNSRSQDVG